jgi:hypothetical protein
MTTAHRASLPATEARLDELSLDECLALLRKHDVGRVAVIVGEFPVVVPVSYRFVETAGRRWVAFRTRAGNIIEQGSMFVSFQLDGIDSARRQGWSVLVRGTLHRVNPDVADFRARFDPRPFIEGDRDAWLIVDPVEITGRRLHAGQRSRADRANAGTSVTGRSDAIGLGR